MTGRVHRALGILRQAVAAGLCYTISFYSISFSCAWGQGPAIEPVKPQAPALWRPYLAPEVSPVRLNNSTWMKDLIRAGSLYLTLQDAIALVLENNLEIEVARYEPITAVWELQRAEAGPGQPALLSSASLVGSVAPGQGVAGSETAAGITPTQTSSAVRSANVTISPVGPVVQSLDPVFQESTVLSHTSQPQYDTQLSLTPVLVETTHASVSNLQEGFLSGGSITVGYSDHYLNENATTDNLNPSVASTLSLSFQHNLLRGFGVAVNSRAITIAKINERVSDLTFKLQVINVVNQTLQLYYGLAAEYEDVKSKQSALELAQALYEDNKKQVQVGSLAPLDVTVAESQVAAGERDLIISQTALQQRELQLKNLLSRTGSADPVLRDVRILPIDRIVLPENDNLPPLETMVQQALANRADLAIEKATIEAAEVSALGTKNGILPALQVFGSEADAGLAGTRRTVIVHKVPELVDAFFAGGTGTALGQVFRRDFPTDRAGAGLQAPILNREAQADYGFDQLSLRQIQLTNEKDISQVTVDLMNSVVMLQQARARYEAAVKNRSLEKRLLDSEQEAYAVGKSTPYLVTQQQRDLATAQFAEIVAMVTWRSALIVLDETLGTTLETNHVSIGEAKAGKVARSATPRQN
jgi:outer membrane protein